MTKDDLGYWWAIYKDFNTPIIVEVSWVTWDHTRDGDRLVIYDGGEMVEENEFHKYNLFKKIDKPEWPYE